MKASESGIHINKAEISALLTFTADTDNFSNVHFHVESGTGKLTAMATDGHRAVEVFSTVEPDDETICGEWRVDAEFLKKCQGGLGKGETCVLQVTKAGLRKAVIVHDESGEEQQTILWPRDAASTQITMQVVQKITRIDRRLDGSWFAVQARYLKDIATLSAACGNAPVTIYPPVDNISPLCFEASGYEAKWAGVVMPVKVAAPGEGVDAEAKEYDPSEEEDD